MKHTLKRAALIIAAFMVLGHAFAETLPDPTRPANYSIRLAGKEALPPQLTDWDVRAIRTSASGRNAVVNGKLVKIGDAIDTATIVDITADTVVLDYNRKQQVLRLVPENIKIKSAQSPDQLSN